jgi:hypothetical protein
MMRSRLLIALAAAVSTPALAITIDGTRDVDYGPALAVQTVQTGFGDNFSEWNAAYATISGGKLNLMLTGNLEDNFNKLDIFIDSKVGGQSVFDSSGNDGAGAMDGLVFDVGFTADYHVIARRGGGNSFDLDFANLGSQSASGYFNLFSGATFGSGATGTGVNAVAINVGYDGSNVAGIMGSAPNAADPMAAAAVTTGLELSIDLADLGYIGGPLNVMVGQNNQNHNYWSNQFLGGLTAPQGNLGGDGLGGFTGEGAIDFTQLAGNQYFTIRGIPEPTTMVLVAVGSLFGLLRRR